MEIINYTETLKNIKEEMPFFNKEELIEYTKWAVQKLYNAIKNEDEIKIKCKEGLINKLIKEKFKYRITKDIDHISVQYAQIYDFNKIENKKYIKVYTSVYFYDNVTNNMMNSGITKDRYWNDIWIVTYEDNSEIGCEKDNKCNNCGAIMEYDSIKEVVKCKYCGNTIYNKLNGNWTIEEVNTNWIMANVELVK